MHNMQLSPSHMSKTMQLRELSPLKYLDQQWENKYLPDVGNIWSTWP